MDKVQKQFEMVPFFKLLEDRSAEAQRQVKAIFDAALFGEKSSVIVHDVVLGLVRDQVFISIMRDNGVDWASIFGRKVDRMTMPTQAEVFGVCRMLDYSQKFGGYPEEVLQDVLDDAMTVFSGANISYLKDAFAVECADEPVFVKTEDGLRPAPDAVAAYWRMMGEPTNLSVYLAMLTENHTHRVRAYSLSHRQRNDEGQSAQREAGRILKMLGFLNPEVSIDLSYSQGSGASITCDNIDLAEMRNELSKMVESPQAYNPVEFAEALWTIDMQKFINKNEKSIKQLVADIDRLLKFDQDTFELEISIDRGDRHYVHEHSTCTKRQFQTYGADEDVEALTENISRQIDMLFRIGFSRQFYRDVSAEDLRMSEENVINEDYISYMYENFGDPVPVAILQGGQNDIIYEHEVEGMLTEEEMQKLGIPSYIFKSPEPVQEQQVGTAFPM